MGFERIFVGKELCCHSAIQLFSSGRAKNYDKLGTPLASRSHLSSREGIPQNSPQKPHMVTVYIASVSFASSDFNFAYPPGKGIISQSKLPIFESNFNVAQLPL
jgi:hypothetical protein